MRLMVLDFLLTILHLLIIGFNLLGWIFKTTRKTHLWLVTATLGCWVVLGFWFGFGYCPITDWQWYIKAQLGEQNLPDSFIKYFADKVLKSNINADLIDALTLLFFLISIGCTIKVNFFNRKIKSQ
jgi:hypothetical protein